LRDRGGYRDHQYGVDHSIASAAGLFNIAILDWDSDALAFAGITPERLSVPVPTIHRVSKVSMLHRVL
jgi:gluconokinase